MYVHTYTYIYIYYICIYTWQTHKRALAHQCLQQRILADISQCPCEMTYSYTYAWHDSFTRDVRLIHVCAMTHSCLCHDSNLLYTGMPLCTHTRAHTHNSFLCDNPFTSDMTHEYVCRDSDLWSTDMSRGPLCHDDMYSHVCYVVTMTDIQVRHDSIMCVSSLRHVISQHITSSLD